MDPQKQNPTAWRGLNLAMVIAAGVLCLMASAIADSHSTCSSSASKNGPSNCHKTPTQQLGASKVHSAPSTKSDHDGAWAFILPGARAFSTTIISAPSHIEVPDEPQLRSVFADIPIYRIAPKNSDPYFQIFA